MAEAEPPELSPFERAAMSLTRFTNERPVPKWLQSRFVRNVSRAWIRAGVAHRTYVDGIDWLSDFEADRGVLLASNHRSFFDMYLALLAVVEAGVPCAQRLYFPVRSNFFYDHPLGLLVNFAVGGGSMYPPIFRDRSRSALNQDALARTCRFLATPGTMVGVHPEGTRNKGGDPYDLLPAQPGIGQIILHAKPIVVPMFINGLGNDLLRDIRKNYHRDIRRENPVMIVFGTPFDYSAMAAKKPRAALYKKTSDALLEEIRSLGEREKELRARCRAGDIPDGDPGWLENRAAARRPFSAL